MSYYGQLLPFSFSVLMLCVSYWHAKKEIALQKAIRDAQFFPYYQAIVDAKTGRMVGVEALLRWLLSDGQIIEPRKFIKHLEQSGAIIPVTENLIQTVYQELYPLMDQHEQFYCSVNITPLHLQNDDFYRYLQRAKLDCSKLVLELTEREPIDDLEFARHVLCYSKH
ncbi:hypothetical protein VoSk93_43460 [Vibrio owensii]